MRGEPVIVARQISKYYNRTREVPLAAVVDLTLIVHAAEILLISGPNGSGKTTLLSMLGCLLRPSCGTLTVLGRDVSSASASDLEEFRRRRIGFVFQAFRLLAGLSVLENVELPMRLNGTGRAEARARARDLLTQLDLSRRESYRPPRLSGGERQRVAIARAIANNPDIILADEPTGNLDSRGGQEVIEMLADSARSAGRTVVIVSHDPRIARFAQRELKMEDGRLRE